MCSSVQRDRGLQRRGVIRVLADVPRSDTGTGAVNIFVRREPSSAITPSRQWSPYVTHTIAEKRLIASQCDSRADNTKRVGDE